MKDVDSLRLSCLYNQINEAIVATTNNIIGGDKPSAMKVGTIQLVDNQGNTLGTYQFRNGGSGRGYIPTGTYVIGKRLDIDRNDPNEVSGMTVDGISYKYRVMLPNGSQKIPDPRVEHIPVGSNPQGGPRSGILIHPDGGGTGTAGCIGIIGGKDIQLDFVRNMDSLIQQGGGKYTLNFDTQPSTAEPKLQTTGLPHPTKEQDKYKEYLNQLYRDL